MRGMRVAVVSASVPFVRGGAEMLEEGLVQAMRARGVHVEHIRLPFAWNEPSDVRRSMAAAMELEVPRVDRLVPLKFPGWLVRHDCVVPWVFHQFRQMYDLWEGGFSGYEHCPDEALALRSLVWRLDSEALGACDQVYTYSPVNAARLQRFNGVSSTLLLSPMPFPTAFASGPYGDAVVALGRVCGSKRQQLAVEALARTETPVRLVVAGVADPPEYGFGLRELAIELGVADRFTYIDRFITEQEKVDLLAGSLASMYIPIDEDNFGYVTGESFLAERPVITATDSGGVCWIVRDGETGLVAEPTPGAMAAAMDQLFEDRSGAARMGANGAVRLRELRLDWDHAVETLLA